MRFLQSLGGGLVVALLLFILMNSLVSGGQQQADEATQVDLQDFVRVARQERLETKQREAPKKPEPPKRPDTPQQMSQQQDQVQGPKLDIDLPKIDVPYGGAGAGLFIPASGGAAGGAAAFGDGDLIPIVRIEPQWPREALINGISGEVLLSFTVLEDGSVEPGSVKVMSAKPPRMFDSSAMRAVARWKFKPMIIDGRPVRRQAQQAVKFNIEAEDDRK